MNIREIAIQAASESVRKMVRPEDEITLVIVTPHISSIVFKRHTWPIDLDGNDDQTYTLQVEHLGGGERYMLRAGKRIDTGSDVPRLYTGRS